MHMAGAGEGLHQPCEMQQVDTDAEVPTWPRILLAEDNQANVELAMSMLRRLGCEGVKVVSNGVEALEAIRYHSFDLLLLDICMPVMDGLEVAQAIRYFERTARWPTALSDDSAGGDVQEATLLVPRLPIVAVTADALRSDVERCFAHGIDAFIAKPLKFQKLHEVLLRYQLDPAGRKRLSE